MPVPTVRASVKLELCRKIAQGVPVRITKSPESFEMSKKILSQGLLFTNMATMIKLAKQIEVVVIGKSVIFSVSIVVK